MSVVVEVDSAFEGDSERVEGGLPAVRPAGSAAAGGVEAIRRVGAKLTRAALVKELDNDGRSLPGGSRVITPAKPGNDLVLTLKVDSGSMQFTSSHR